jgi:tRNA A-37 threonylcarbamoyl transferase component Bud32
MTVPESNPEKARPPSMSALSDRYPFVAQLWSEYRQLWQQHVGMSLGGKLACTANLPFLVLISLYFIDEIDRQKELPEPVVAPSLRATVDSTVCDFKGFLATSLKVNPFLLIPAFVFVVLLCVFNVIAHWIPRQSVMFREWRRDYEYMSSNFTDPRWIRDIALDVRPLLLTWILLVPPLAIACMFINFFVTLAKPFLPKASEEKQFGVDCLRFQQQIDRSGEPGRTTFYNSPWFTSVMLVPFLLGIPGAISLGILFLTGANVTLGHPEHDPQFNYMVKILFYIYPLSWCLCALFFRSYFTYAWNFCSTEYAVEVYPDMIKALPMKGWFLDFLTLRGMHCPGQILWKDVESIKFSSAQLKSEVVKDESAIFATVRKLSSVYDSVASKLDIHTECLLIKSKAKTISVNLWELSAEQKLSLFQALRKYAPFLHLDADVQQALVGSAVLREPKYTEIWFSVLTSGNDGSRDGDLNQGQVLREGRYTVKSKVASGGQAVIYQAADADGNVVVLKEFQLTLGESLDVKIESAKDFENESALLDQLSHPAIVKLLDMFYEEGRMYLVLEHVEGVSLRQYVKMKGSLATGEIMELAEQMCEILRYLHGQTPPVVHRDFTPDNIILQPNGKLKLIDFSVAQKRKDKSATADCAGKHAYTPPEQFRGEAEPQSDIYALGATMYFLATGSDPTPISESQLPDVDGAADSTRLALSKVIAHATKLSVTERYESIEWLLNDLKGSSTLVGDNESVGRVLSKLAECTESLETAAVEPSGQKICLSGTYRSSTANVKLYCGSRRTYLGTPVRRHIDR